jgi:hypothetical protein
MNLVHSSLQCNSGESLLELGPVLIPISQQVLANLPDLASRCEEKLLVRIPPHAIQLTNTQSAYSLPARVFSVEPKKISWTG